MKKAHTENLGRIIPGAGGEEGGRALCIWLFSYLICNYNVILDQCSIVLIRNRVQIN